MNFPSYLSKDFYYLLSFSSGLKKGYGCYRLFLMSKVAKIMRLDSAFVEVVVCMRHLDPVMTV